MQFDPNIHKRRSIRLRNYDYSQAGLYFITICCHNRQPLFGKIVDGGILHNAAGITVIKIWNEMAERFKNIQLHESVVMPNHFHGIIEIADGYVGAPLVGAQKIDDVKSNFAHTLNRAPTRGAPTGATNHKTIGNVVGAFKSLTTNAYIHGVKNENWPPFNKYLWQRNYYEHVIRNELAYLKISEYIQTNPARWLEDTYYCND